ncbi:CLUMA_CG004719, isoform A [Clunio marinus]|uniref:CLUMA_CG004719, isoform A n=1 Tax=Clunio marinus TaxID=568069 RepID=A0A1J1HSJ8_9DIPT|nr:CLUMA_CG004719, isoform A [Clunio marinus]
MTATLLLQRPTERVELKCKFNMEEKSLNAGLHAGLRRPTVGLNQHWPTDGNFTNPTFMFLWSQISNVFT